MNASYREQACQLSTKASELRTKLSLPLNELVDFYIANSPAEAELLGIFVNDESGQASFRAMAAYKAAAHEHEFVHVLSMESTRYVSSFIEEGLATAAGDPIRIQTKEQYVSALSLLEGGSDKWLDSSLFLEATLREVPVYELSQQVVAHWIDTFGIKSLMSLKKGPGVAPGELRVRIASSLEPPSKTDAAVRTRIQAPCRTLDHYLRPRPRRSSISATIAARASGERFVSALGKMRDSSRVMWLA
jgi:hypothetical protein